MTCHSVAVGASKGDEARIGGCSAGPGGHRHRWAGRGQAFADGVQCERPSLMRCVCGDAYSARCQASSRAMCAPCAESYRRRVRRVAASGFAMPGRQTFLLTLTAPSDVDRHKYRGGWCPCTPAGGVDLATWNGSMARRWNQFITDVRRTIGECEYFAAKESQVRGALHLHVPIRFAVGVRVRLSKLRALAIRHGFGHAVDLQVLEDDRAAGYVSKYVTKAAEDRASVPFVHAVTGEVGPGRWRTWSASRRWGSTMAQVRAAQRAWWSEAVSSGGVPGGPRTASEAAEAGAQGVAVGGPLDINTASYASGSVVPVPAGRSLTLM
jgi:hypothetical protein